MVIEFRSPRGVVTITKMNLPSVIYYCRWPRTRDIPKDIRGAENLRLQLIFHSFTPGLRQTMTSGTHRTQQNPFIGVHTWILIMSPF
ncbi:hypothetical protein PoB_000192200 [Plakobranchus ocellatus]|uniref:Uncharacterized protein n=1 Tax=Plakobranchus ocellatus TaxID=259542 RepID=A0AAV3XZ52_9GAST|nr:hypothetical protein PoB_000192200 [Plakobranchus ocellatus]